MADDQLPTSRRERALLADLFDEVGDEAPTLCGDWTTRDLAAHLVIRERRPDAAAGVVVSALAGYTDKVQSKVANEPWDELVGKVRSGPGAWSPTRISAVDKAMNTAEFFVHHEDVRRATEGWTERDLDQQTRDDLRAALARFGKSLTRGLDHGLVLAPTDTTDSSPLTVRNGDPVVEITGPVAELMMFIYGRQEQSHVDVSGPDELVEKVRSANFGI